MNAATKASACGETKIIEQEDEVRTCADSRFCHSVSFGVRVVCEEGFRIHNCVVAACTAASSPVVTGILRLLCPDAVHSTALRLEPQRSSRRGQRDGQGVL